MGAELWNVNTPVTGMSPVYAKATDVHNARAAINATSHSPLFYSVSPNGEPLLGFIHAYVVGQFERGYQWIERLDLAGYEYPVRHILRGVARITHALQQHESVSVTQECTSLQLFLRSLDANAAGRVPRHLYRLLGELSEIAATSMAPLENGSPFIHGPGDSPKNWWVSSPQLASSLTHAGVRLGTAFAPLPQELLQIRNWLDSRIGHLNGLHTASTATSELSKAALNASAYCAALAEHQLANSRHGLGLLYLHRSADLFMFSLCIAFGAIDFTSKGGRYQATLAPTPNVISLLNSVALLDSFNRLPFNMTKADFDEINEWRNVLIQTHFMSDVLPKTALQILFQIRSKLEAAGGSDWGLVRDKYMRGIDLPLCNILNTGFALTRTFAMQVL